MMQHPHKSDPMLPFAGAQLLRSGVRQHRKHFARLSTLCKHGRQLQLPVLALAAGRASWFQNARDRFQGKTGPKQDFGHPARRVTDTLLVLNAVCYIGQILSKGSLTVWGIKHNASIAAGQWWRFLTPVFLHSGLLHFGMNSYSLNAVGPFAEQVMNRRRLLAVYVAGGVGGVILSYLRSPELSLGASGAIFGLVASEIVYLLRHRSWLGKDADAVLGSLGQVVLVNLVLGLQPRIDNWGHIGGFLGGWVAATLLGPSWQAENLTLVDSPPVPLFASAKRQLR